MNKLTLAALIGVAAAITLMNGAAMLWYEGHISLNDYHEGWLEVIATGLITIMGLKEISFSAQ